MATPAHLGGHANMTWVDAPVLDELIRRYSITTMLDVGCGPGGMLELAASRGIEAYGVDGDPACERWNVQIHDYAIGPLLADGWDLIWCCEFVEHVEAQYQDNYLTTFDGGRVLYLTAAYPGQGGHHHVNEQPAEYWINLLSQRGWALDKDATAWVREHGATPFAHMTGLVFVRSI